MSKMAEQAAGVQENESAQQDGSGAADQANTENDTSGTTSTAGDFKPITSQSELDAALKGRLERERAKFKDYPDLKAKAAKFDQVTQAQKSELQLAIERAEAAERQATDLQAEREISDFKSQVAKATGVPVDVLRGTTLEEIETHAASVKALLPEPRKPGHVPGEGRTVTAGSGDPAQQFAELIRNARK